MPDAINMIGYKTGLITVIERAGSKKGQATWLCECTCGKRFIQYGSALRKEKVKSCGHLYNDKEERRKIAHNTIAKTKHGDCFARLYFVWLDMRARCNNPKDISYDNYGAKGVKVCEEWIHDYPSFKKWAMENGYNSKASRGECTLDRIDNTKGYSPQNCRWVNMKIQSNNKSTTKFLTVNGETHSYSEWAEITGIPRSRIYQRVKYGWPAEDVLSKDDYRIKQYSERHIV